MAPNTGKPFAAQRQRSPAPAAEEPPPVIGPSPGKVNVANQYTFEQNIRRLLKEYGCDPAREDLYRIQGVQLIDTVRQSLRLPVRTFTTACTYYHLFRLCHRDAEYNYQDASLASLFMACKVEDTIKKSREILCATYNMKNPDHTVTQDDKIFEGPQRIIIGLERHILETIGFDFRARYPQKLLIKIVRDLFSEEESRKFIPIAYDMSLDMYKTFAPVKASSFTMVLAIVELTALLTNTGVEQIRSLDPGKYCTSRASVVESMLDLLDLYTQFDRHNSKLGTKFDMKLFLDLKIKINEEVDKSDNLRRFGVWCERCEDEDRIKYPVTPGSATSPATTGSWPGGNSAKRMKSGQDGSTTRFVYDTEEAQREKEIVDEYFREDFEEYEVEVEEKIPEQDHRGHHGGRDRGRHNSRNHHDSGWGGPYSRNRHGHGHDRHKGGRKGGF